MISTTGKILLACLTATLICPLIGWSDTVTNSVLTEPSPEGKWTVTTGPVFFHRTISLNYPNNPPYSISAAEDSYGGFAAMERSICRAASVRFAFLADETTDFNFATDATEADETLELSAKLYPLQILPGPTTRFRPYLLVLLQETFYQISLTNAGGESQSRDDQSFVGGGCGFDLSLTKRWLLMCEVDYYRSITDVDYRLTTSLPAVYDYRASEEGFIFRQGLSFRF